MKIFAAAVAVALVGVGGYTVLPLVHHQTAVIIEQDPKESTAAWIEGATEKVALICRETATLKHKQEYVNIVKNPAMGAVPELEAFNKQIIDHQNNIKEYLVGYVDYITKLSHVGQDIVNTELGKYREQLAQKQKFERIKISNIVVQHYSEAVAAPLDISAETMAQLCPNQAS
ncbi:MAG: hypothetical protein HOP34_12950 [Methylococcaceae bacterium]|nr:hypothetical protein [Methylococcaceae bacterium]